MMTSSKRILLVEDHAFFAKEIIEYLTQEKGFEVSFASNFKDAQKILKKQIPFDYSLLDIILQNGKTGVDILEKHKELLGRVIFITGCIDDTILDKIQGYPSVSKLDEIWPILEIFFAGGVPKIGEENAESISVNKNSSALRSDTTRKLKSKRK